MSHWLKRRAEDPLEETPDVSDSPADDIAPLDKLDQDRAPAPVAPGGLPGESRPMSATEVMAQLETAGKALLDSGLDIEKASAAISKIRSMSGKTEADQAVLKKSDELLGMIRELKDLSDNAAVQVTSYREELSPKQEVAKKSSWI